MNRRTKVARSVEGWGFSNTCLNLSHRARSQRPQLDKNTSSGRLGMKRKAEAHFRSSPGPVRGTRWETELGQYLLFSCLQTLQRLVVTPQQLLQPASIAVFLAVGGGCSGRRRGEVGQGRPKAHAGRDGCLGGCRTCTHQSHRWGERRKHR